MSQPFRPALLATQAILPDPRGQPMVRPLAKAITAVLFIQPSTSPPTLVISDKIASRPPLGEESRAAPGIRSGAVGGHRHHRHRATLGREKGEPSQRVIWES